MSICLTIKPFTGTRAKHALKVSAQTTGEYVSIYSCPGRCTHPFTTSLALWRITWFDLLCFLTKVHLFGMVMASSGFSTSSHVPISSNNFNSSPIALRHSSQSCELLASFKLFSSSPAIIVYVSQESLSPLLRLRIQMGYLNSGSRVDVHESFTVDLYLHPLDFP